MIFIILGALILTLCVEMPVKNMRNFVFRENKEINLELSEEFTDTELTHKKIE